MLGAMSRGTERYPRPGAACVDSTQTASGLPRPTVPDVRRSHNRPADHFVLTQHKRLPAVALRLAPEDEPDRFDRLGSLVVQPVGDRRVERGRIAGIERVVVEADGQAEAALEHDPE